MLAFLFDEYTRDPDLMTWKVPDTLLPRRYKGQSMSELVHTTFTQEQPSTAVSNSQYILLQAVNLNQKYGELDTRRGDP